MMGLGYLIGSWLMNKSKSKAMEKLNIKESDQDFLKSKIVSADFYDTHILPRSNLHLNIVSNGSKVVFETLDSNV
jgi:hypothetical protein